MLLKGYITCIRAAFKRICIISELRLLKSFVKTPIYLIKRFNILSILEISRKKSALVVFHVLYTHYIFNILGVLLFKSSQAKLSLSFIGFSSSF